MIEDIMEEALEESSFEEILEIFDLTPTEVMVLLYNQGMIDPYLFEEHFNAI